MSSLSAYPILLGFLLPCMWRISSRLLQQSTAAAPYLGRVAPPDLERGVAPLGPPAPAQRQLLGGGVAPLSCTSALSVAAAALLNISLYTVKLLEENINRTLFT